MDRIVNGFGALLFLASAGVQLNDPDPFRWITVYTVSAGLCLWAIKQRTVPVQVALPWAFLTGFVAVGMYAWAPPGSHRMPGFPSWGPLAEEVVRESLGLTLCSLWAFGLAAHAAWSGSHAPAVEDEGPR